MKKQYWERATWVMLITLLVVCIHYAGCALISLEVGNNSSVATYSSALQSLRNAVKHPTRTFFGIPMFPEAPNPLTYLTFELKSSNTQSITLGLERRNIYVVGYAGNFNGVNRSYFVTDAPNNARTTLFNNTTRHNLTFGGSYAQLQNMAGVKNRANFGLGMQKLNNRIGRLFEQNNANAKTQAEFMLIAVQIIAEATRFTYIENQVRANFPKFEFLPDPKVISLENEWGKISAGIRNAAPNGTIKPPLTIVDEKNKTISVDKVSDIKPDMGILNYVK